MTALVGYKGSVLLTASPSVAATNLTLVDSGDHQTYNVSTSSTQRYWDKTQTALFVLATSPDGSAWTVSTAYTIAKYVNGQIKMNVAQSAGTQVRMNTVYYFSYSVLGDTKEWGLNLDSDMYDASVFSTTGWKNQVQGIQKVSSSLMKFWTDGSLLALMGSLVVLVLYPDSTSNNRYEAYAYLKSHAIKDPAAGLVDISGTLEIDGQLYYMTN